MQFISFHIYSFLCQGEEPRNIWYTKKTFVYKVWWKQVTNRRKTGKSSIVNANSTNLTCRVYKKILSVKNHLLLISINFCWRPPNWSKLSNSRCFDGCFSKKRFYRVSGIHLCYTEKTFCYKLQGVISGISLTLHPEIRIRHRSVSK